MFKKISLFFILLFFAAPVSAVCPVCTISVCFGVGFSRWLGVDDKITGLWIGGLIVSLIIWTINWLDKKNIRFMFRKIIVVLAYYLIIIVPMYTIKIGGDTIMGHPTNKVWGMDKLLFSIIIGSIAFFAGNLLHLWLKNKNNGKSYFPFQKVAIPILPLIILSFVICNLVK